MTWEELKRVFKDTRRYYATRASHAERLAEQDAWVKSTGGDEWFSSARNLEAATGVRNIAGHYRLPEGVTRESIQHVLTQESLYFSVAQDIRKGGIPPFAQTHAIHAEGQLRLPIMLNIIDKVTQSNSTLKQLVFDRTDRHQVTQVLAGIHYDFNSSDINYHVNRKEGPEWLRSYYKEQDGERREMDAKVSKLGKITYNASPSTLRYILEQVEGLAKTAKNVGLKAIAPLQLLSTPLTLLAENKEGGGLIETVAKQFALNLDADARSVFKEIYLISKTEQSVSGGLSDQIGFTKFIEWGTKHHLPLEALVKLNPTSRSEQEIEYALSMSGGLIAQADTSEIKLAQTPNVLPRDGRIRVI